MRAWRCGLLGPMGFEAGKLNVEVGGCRYWVGKKRPRLGFWVPDGFHVWWGPRGVHMYVAKSHFQKRIMFDRIPEDEWRGTKWTP